MQAYKKHLTIVKNHHVLERDKMKKVFNFSLASISIILLSWFFGGCSSVDSKPINMGELERLNLLSLDSSRFQLTEGQMKHSLLLIVFNPTCDHCQAEAKEIKANINKLKDVTILMIASVHLKDIHDFSVNYGMNELENVDFVYTSPLYGYQFFGAIQLPHLRLYDRSFKLVKTFSGSTSVDDIISHLK
jgi:thioredoxin-related protein